MAATFIGFRNVITVRLPVTSLSSTARAGTVMAA
jgi:hypothetical protein